MLQSIFKTLGILLLLLLMAGFGICSLYGVNSYIENAGSADALLFLLFAAIGAVCAYLCFFALRSMLRSIFRKS
ncbi:hypothetical protein V8J88_09355 [Massilia sp. W12]|uniref:hypothetical protein n=1 Tax=Massilia sp. W12 TaxID=3126507 RepID=UPI0030D13A9C